MDNRSSAGYVGRANSVRHWKRGKHGRIGGQEQPGAGGIKLKIGCKVSLYFQGAGPEGGREGGRVNGEDGRRTYAFLGVSHVVCGPLFPSALQELLGGTCSLESCVAASNRRRGQKLDVDPEGAQSNFLLHYPRKTKQK